ncbi:uncharacterized protein TrAFT101_011318 [Trichoderma asperellum]|uniref:uncharacterized protein n=1 Tax=Trichoderma asperellum TaxID=101201 RepID=UPI003330223A|nr:hypothetical protein TrAFT101_011318 [Trichoderma asperellum]
MNSHLSERGLLQQPCFVSPTKFDKKLTFLSKSSFSFTMKLLSTLPVIGLVLQAGSSRAADCGFYGVGSDGIGACTDRNGNYADRTWYATAIMLGCI